MTAMFVNLPVTDLERAKAFYTAIGFTINLADHNAARAVVEDGQRHARPGARGRALGPARRTRPAR